MALLLGLVPSIDGWARGKGGYGGHSYSRSSSHGSHGSHSRHHGGNSQRHSHHRATGAGTARPHAARSHRGRTYRPRPSYERRSATAGSVRRDSRGRIRRSSAARNAFKRSTGYPHGRPGYIIDHIVPLKRGGCDCPENMQWQTRAEAKAKDRWE